MQSLIEGSSQRKKKTNLKPKAAAIKPPVAKLLKD